MKCGSNKKKGVRGSVNFNHCQPECTYDKLKYTKWRINIELIVLVYYVIVVINCKGYDELLYLGSQFHVYFKLILFI